MKQYLLGAACLACGMAMAGHHDHDHDHDRQHGAHVHGVASLSVAVEGSGVHVELDSPAANIVGFEHAPESRAEHQATGLALAQLRDGTRLFEFPQTAGCQLSKVDIDAPHLEPSAHAGDHADIRAEYRFDCNDAGHLDAIEVRLFAAFPAIEQLQTQFITMTGQGGKVLTATDSRLTFE